MRLALAQIISTPDPRANLDLVRDMAASAAAQGAELVLFPEATMRSFGNALAEVAEPLDGPWADAVRVIASEHEVAVAVGMFTPADAGRVRNTLLVVGPGVEASYDKIHLFDAFGFAESDTVAPGVEPLVVSVAGVRVGFATCYDVRFPELFTALADRGAQVVCLAASWGAGPEKVDQWELLVRARALDATTFVAACGQGDPATTGQALLGSAPTGVGHSMVVSPNGTVIAGLDAAPGLLLVDINVAEVEVVRETIPVLANRRL